MEKENIWLKNNNEEPTDTTLSRAFEEEQMLSEYLGALGDVAQEQFKNIEDELSAKVGPNQQEQSNHIAEYGKKLKEHLESFHRKCMEYLKQNNPLYKESLDSYMESCKAIQSILQEIQYTNTMSDELAEKWEENKDKLFSLIPELIDATEKALISQN